MPLMYQCWQCRYKGETTHEMADHWYKRHDDAPPEQWRIVKVVKGGKKK